MDTISILCLVFAILIFAYAGVAWEAFRCDYRYALSRRRKKQLRGDLYAGLFLAMLLLVCDFGFWALNLAELIAKGR